MPQKYEREIDEILSRLDQGTPGRILTPLPPLERRPARAPRLRWHPSWRIELSPSALMITALSLAIVSYPFQWVYPPAVAVIGVASAVMLIGSLLLSVLKWNRSRPTKTWRGQPMELGGGFSPSSISRRWRRWRAHRRFHDPRWN